MPLRLSIENVTNLPNGGPIQYEISGKRGIDIGRDAYLDWVLPDPERVVSGKHCEIRYRDGSYWLRDLSSNGTYVNQNPRRLQEPHELRNGDRLEIGHYIIAVALDGEEAGAATMAAPGDGGEPSLWGVNTHVAPPDPELARRQPLRPAVITQGPWIDLPPAPPPHAIAPPLDNATGDMPPGDIWGAEPPRARSTRPPPETPFEFPPPPQPVQPPPQPYPQPAPPPQQVQPPIQEPPVAPQIVAPPPPPPAPAPPPAPMPAPVTHPAPTPAMAQMASAQASATINAEVIRRFAEGAGIEPGAIGTRDAGDLAELAGMLMAVCAGNVAQLLSARAHSKSAMRSRGQTVIQLQGNNPLRWAPTPQDALKVMLGRPTPSYVDACKAFEMSFEVLKSHQLDTFAALQETIQILLADLDPGAIERAEGGEKKGGLFKSDKAHKARLWDEFVVRWKSKTSAYDSGMFGAFMRLFGEAYDRKGD